MRLGRILKLLKMKRQLAQLVETILSTLSAMFWLSVLLFILIYTLAICTVQFVGRTDIYPKHEFDNKLFFGDMVAAGVTGLNLAMLEDLEIGRAILKYQPLYALGIGVYVGIASFGIMNAIIGVIVTKTSAAAEELESENAAHFRKRQMIVVKSISELIYAIDVDRDGTVSPEEIEAAEDDRELMGVLEHMSLPFSFSLTELHTMLDKDGDGALTKLEFFTGMRRLIFSNEFQRQCLVSLSSAQIKRKLFEVKSELEDGFKGLTSRLDTLLENAGKAPPDIPPTDPPPACPSWSKIPFADDMLGQDMQKLPTRPTSASRPKPLERPTSAVSRCAVSEQSTGASMGWEVQEHGASMGWEVQEHIDSPALHQKLDTLSSAVQLQEEALLSLHHKFDALNLDSRCEGREPVAPELPFRQVSPVPEFNQIVLMQEDILALIEEKFAAPALHKQNDFTAMSQDIKSMKEAFLTFSQSAIRTSEEIHTLPGASNSPPVLGDQTGTLSPLEANVAQQNWSRDLPKLQELQQSMQESPQWLHTAHITAMRSPNAPQLRLPAQLPEEDATVDHHTRPAAMPGAMPGAIAAELVAGAVAGAMPFAMGRSGVVSGASSDTHEPQIRTSLQAAKISPSPAALAFAASLSTRPASAGAVRRFQD